jgi:glycosyltransferase involved in cell wall biosynthesis
VSKIVALARIKDARLFIDEWLAKTGSLVDEIVAVDNGSTDGTYEILASHPRVVDLARTEGYHEGRDKILAYEMARRREPDWVLFLDVDEIFEDGLDRRRLDELLETTTATRILFRKFNLCGDEYHFEASWRNLWAISGPDRCLWREQPTGYFSNLKVHNGGINGITGRSKIVPYRLKHFGALDKKYLARKTANYIAVDPGNEAIYVRHRDQKVRTWRWWEASERPLLVAIQFRFLNALWWLKYGTLLAPRVLTKPARIWRAWRAPA